MKRSLHAYFLVCGVIAWSVGCSARPASEQAAYDSEDVSSMVLELMVVPASVKCVNVTVVTAGSSRAQTFTVTGGAATTTLNIGLLALGSATVTAEAYDAVCSSIAGTTPSWIADNVGTTLRTGAPVTLQLAFRRNNPVSATAAFAENIVKISAGSTGTLAVTANGNLLCTGVVNGACSGTATPVIVAGISDAVDVGVGSGHACYRKQSGQVACFGMNGSGQLGNGTTSSSTLAAPGSTVALSNVSKLAVGGMHTCALLNDQTIRCWGENSSGQLGDGTTTNRSAPVAVSGGFTAIRIAASYFSTCVVNWNNRVFCWGSAAQGALGNNSTLNATNPSGPLTGPSPAVDVVMGAFHGCARTAAGALWCWGYNSNGQIGDGTTANKPMPVLVSVGGEASQLALNYYSTCALVVGVPKCWGDGSTGAIGDRAGTGRTTPTAVYGLTNVDYIASGLSGATFFSVRTGQSVWGWGSNGAHQLGDGTTENRFAPTPLMF